MVVNLFWIKKRKRKNDACWRLTCKANYFNQLPQWQHEPLQWSPCVGFYFFSTNDSGRGVYTNILSVGVLFLSSKFKIKKYST